ncbi:hypothetical protein GCM10010466_19420 [Planomonospora alba]|uniref:Translation initiation factor IF-2 n=1 Tax=Planomonospora alba TaxID=161354 RepID=A0ABP6MWU0_9ACTN
MRSRRHRGGHRRKKARSRAIELYVGAAAVAVAVTGVVVAGSPFGAGRAPGGAAGAPQARAAVPPGGAPDAVASAVSSPTAAPPAAGGRRSSMVTAELDGTGSGAPAGKERAAGGAGAREDSGRSRAAGPGADGSAAPDGQRSGATGSGGAPGRGETGPGRTAGREPGAVEPEADGPGEGKKGQSAKEVKAAGRSRHTDTRAIAYFQRNEAMDRVRDIRMVGGYLRIYTDLPESADNSKQAIKLCETGLDYLAEELGEEEPVVFVQARFGENGNPVLANVLGPDDSSCRVTHPEPEG